MSAAQGGRPARSGSSRTTGRCEGPSGDCPFCAGLLDPISPDEADSAVRCRVCGARWGYGPLGHRSPSSQRARAVLFGLFTLGAGSVAGALALAGRSLAAVGAGASVLDVSWALTVGTGFAALGFFCCLAIEAVYLWKGGRWLR